MFPPGEYDAIGLAELFIVGLELYSEGPEDTGDKKDILALQAQFQQLLLQSSTMEQSIQRLQSVCQLTFS